MAIREGETETVCVITCTCPVEATLTFEVKAKNAILIDGGLQLILSDIFTNLLYNKKCL